MDRWLIKTTSQISKPVTSTAKKSSCLQELQKSQPETLNSIKANNNKPINCASNGTLTCTDDANASYSQVLKPATSKVDKNSSLPETSSAEKSVNCTSDETSTYTDEADDNVSNSQRSFDVISTDSDRNDNINHDQRRKTLKEKRRLSRFNNAWLELPIFKDWLTKSTEIRNGAQAGFCKVCQCVINAHKNDLIRHKKSAKHTINYSKVSNSQKITDIINTPLDGMVKRAELILSGMLATNNLPFLLMDTLGPLCTDLFPDSKIAQKLSIKRTKATHIITESLGKTFKKRLVDLLKEPGNFFSVVMDETTDVGSIKRCAIAVIYKVKFFDMVQMTCGTAESLYTCLKDSLTEKNIPLLNLIGFSSDTTNVMVGENNSVFSRLKKDIPEILCIKCSCHMINLAASKACLKLPRSAEDLLRNLGSHFSRSDYKQRRLKEFQEFFQSEVHKVLLLATTRWLSLKACVDRVLEQYDPLKAYLRELLFEDPSKTTEEMLRTINNPFTKIYLEFMSYTTSLLVDFNILFQGESPLLHRLKPETTRLVQILCSNYIQINYIKNKDILLLDHKDPRLFVPLEQIYVGILALESLQILKGDENVVQSDIELFFKTCLNFYIELVSQIKSRFDFSDPIFDLLPVVEPKIAQSFEIKSLQKVLQRFSVLKDFVDMQELDKEWKQHALLNFSEYGLNSELKIEEYWPIVFDLKNAAGVLMFKNLKKVIAFLMILPFSNACVERIFSDLKNIKTDKRNLLNSTTLSALITTKQGIVESGGCIKFNPDAHMINANIWSKS